MRVAAIFPVGTSIGGAPRAISEILDREGAVEVHLLYGQAGAPGTRDPKELSEEIKRSSSNPLVHWGESRMVHSFDLPVAYGEIRELVRELARRDYERVYVGATGATNPIVASLFQAAMAYLRADVVPVYVQRYEHQEQAFLGPDIRHQLVAEEALANARAGQVWVASRMSERLPKVEPWKFLRQSLIALAHWDDFDYGQACRSLEQQASKSPEYAKHELLGAPAETVARISANASRMDLLARQLRDIQKFEATATASDWTDRVLEVGALLVADVLANANRRIIEGRYTDSVLRSYRAAECATQIRLLKLRIHPSSPIACPAAYERYSAYLTKTELAFRAGLEFLASVGELNLDPIKEVTRRLSDSRNHTYLEHGYRRVQQQQAEQSFAWSLEICNALLGSSIREKWREFEMRF